MKRVLALTGLVALAAACHSTSGLDSSDQAAAAAPGAGKCDINHPGVALDKLLSTPIVPAHLFDSTPTTSAWSGLSLDRMEFEYCASDPTTEDEATVTAGWGGIAPNYAVTVQYRKTDHQIQFFQLNPGYQGRLEFASRPSSVDDTNKANPFGAHKYSISLGVPLQRDGQDWNIDWTNFDQQATELYDALMFTFAPELKSTQTSCRTDGSCLTRGTDGQGVFGVRPLGIYFTVPKMDAPQPAASTPAYFYGFPLRTTPFSNADVMLALDGDGPTANAANIGPKHSTCSMKLGMPWSAFQSQCVDILYDDHANTALESKILSAASRAVTSSDGSAALDATWVLDVTGVHPNFASVRFSETAPPTDAPINQLVVDQHATGKILNDYAPDGTTLTFEGSAAIYLQYARYVQAFVQSQLGPGAKYGLGDPACMTDKPADGCTGIEQMVLPATVPPSSDPNVQRISVDPTTASTLAIGSALRASDLNATFCSDAPTFKHCTITADGLFEGMRDQMIAVIAKGDASRLPEGLKDRKVFVRLWMKALAKYLRVASQHPSDLTDPKYDAATPADTDITVDSIRGSSWSVKYLDKVELQLNYLVGTGNSLTFR
jgi:hypothetical protein